MSNDWQKVGFFAAGLAIGGIATAALVLGSYSPSARNKPAKPMASQAATAAFRGAECPLEPAAFISGPKDGRYRMPAELSGYATTEPNVFIVMGNEASAAGRSHDAEIAYLMACRVADKFKGAGSVAAADARYELARYYGNLANTANKDAPNCGEMLRRAELMYSDSHQLYRASYGADHEKSRQAAQGLADVRKTLMAQAGVAGASTTPALPLPPQLATPQPDAEVLARERAAQPSAPAASPRAEGRAPIDKARQRSARHKVVATQARPSPACASARTTAQKLICSDVELARLDREVSYLRARARNAGKFEDDWRRREAMCRDRACLLQLIANKRSQLMADINSA